MFDDTALWIAGAGLLSALLWAARIHARGLPLPNILIVSLIAAGLIYNFTASTDFYPFLLGTISAYAFFWLFETAYKITRNKDELGRGTGKLLAAGGAWCAWTGLPFIILIASGSALIWAVLYRQAKKQDMPLAFGPFLPFAIALIWVIQQIRF